MSCLPCLIVVPDSVEEARTRFEKGQIEGSVRTVLINSCRYDCMKALSLMKSRHLVPRPIRRLRKGSVI